MNKPSSLDPQTIELVKASIPFLVERGEELTRNFYGRLFKEHPELLSMFNQSHQHSGVQQGALAAAICSYATHIDNPGALAGAISLIAQKHVSLEVKPEHYPIVGKHLLAAIQDLLGDAASPEILNAWAKAYTFLATVFIQREKDDYARQQRYPGGWNGRRAFRVTGKKLESDQVASFHLEPHDDSGLPSFLPGQYITVFPSKENPSSSPRNYSLSHRPGLKSLRISVKRHRKEESGEPAGKFSNFLHDKIDVGHVLELGPPCGVFHLSPQECAGKTIVLISAGVGQTPLLSMLHGLAEEKSAVRVVYLHVARNGRSHAFREEVEKLQKEWPALIVRTLYTRPGATDLQYSRHFATGPLGAFLWAEAGEDVAAEYYFCGPKRFMQDIHLLLNQNGVPDERQHYEFFGPAESLRKTK